MLKHANYTFLGLTQSLCPTCLDVVPAKIIARGKRVYFRKTCAEHGVREDFVCGDVDWFDRIEFSLPSKLPKEYGVEPNRGCPLDCGLCTEHEQHVCVGLVEITSSCNLRCPMCYAESGPGGTHLSFDDCKRAIDRLVEVEGRPEVLQLSGGEPTVHPQFAEILDYALSQPIDYVMINTNGIRLASDDALLDHVSRHRDRVEIYFQFDGFDEATSVQLRGESLFDVKLRALDRLAEKEIHTTLVCTVVAGVNEHEMGAIVNFAVGRPHVTAVSFQPATYSGRYFLPEEIEKRITFPEVIAAVDRQTNSMFREDDFFPLPCAHPNSHQISYAYRSEGKVTPLSRFIDPLANMDLLANGVSFNRADARDRIEKYLGRQACCGGTCAPDSNGADLSNPPDAAAAGHFFQGVINESLCAENIFRITVTSFLDVYNFDVRLAMKCCILQVLPSGHLIPFGAYNVLYRNGHVPLPPLKGRENTAANVTKADALLTVVE